MVLCNMESRSLELVMGDIRFRLLNRVFDGFLKGVYAGGGVCRGRLLKLPKFSGLSWMSIVTDAFGGGCMVDL